MYRNSVPRNLSLFVSLFFSDWVVIFFRFRIYRFHKIRFFSIATRHAIRGVEQCGTVIWLLLLLIPVVCYTHAPRAWVPRMHEHTSTLYLLVGIMFTYWLKVGVLEVSDEDIPHADRSNDETHEVTSSTHRGLRLTNLIDRNLNLLTRSKETCKKTLRLKSNSGR